jgi:hypothetical protein
LQHRPAALRKSKDFLRAWRSAILLLVQLASSMNALSVRPYF